ncbi:MAG TPA: hypothetical protein PLZ78_08920 [Spirochaetota bacterium]|mgnify:CR=1 FL=1|nr:hypothetical protein [Spirochaetota bacterium]
MELIRMWPIWMSQSYLDPITMRQVPGGYLVITIAGEPVVTVDGKDVKANE